MSFKKAAFVCFLTALFTSSFSYDTQGKFGLGVKIWGSPVITLSTIKLGLTNSIGMEPSIGYYKIGSKTVDDSAYDYVNDRIYTRKVKETESMFILSNTLELKPIRSEKSNFIIKGGASWGILSSKYEDNDPDYVEPDEDPKNPWLISLIGGIGIEHFFTDYFAMNVGITSGFVLLTSPSGDHETSYESLTHIGTQLADFALVLYLK